MSLAAATLGAAGAGGWTCRAAPLAPSAGRGGAARPSLRAENVVILGAPLREGPFWSWYGGC